MERRLLYRVSQQTRRVAIYKGGGTAYTTNMSQNILSLSRGMCRFTFITLQWFHCTLHSNKKADTLLSIRPSVDGLYRDGTVHISREWHKQCLVTRREMTSGAPKPHRHHTQTLL